MPNFQEPYNQLSEHDEKILEKLVAPVDGRMLEIGCWTGHSTSILARHAKSKRWKVVVVDNFGGNEGTPLKEFAEKNGVKQIFLDNMKELGLFDSVILFDMDSDSAHEYLDNYSFSFMFLDGGHGYEQVKKDLKNYIHKLSKDAIICGHDYESETYDERYIEEDYVDGKHHGVIKAVNEVFGKVEHEGRMWWVKLKN